MLFPVSFEVLLNNLFFNLKTFLKMRKNHFLTAVILAISLAAGAQSIVAQTSVKQVIIANGGNFSDTSDYVSIAAYNPVTQTTMTFDTIFTQSVQDVIINGKYAYVAAQDSIVKYDIDNYSRVAAAAVSGTHNLAIYNDQLILSRQYPVVENFVQVFDVNDLSFLYSVPEVSDEAAGIVVVSDTAYIAVPGSYLSTVGKIAVIDLQNHTFVREVNLGEQGIGISNLYSDGNKIYTVNTTPWGGSKGAITTYNINNLQFSTNVIDVVVGKGVSIYGDTLFVGLNHGIGSYNLMSDEIMDTTIIPDPGSSNYISIAAAVFDSVNKNFYVSTTDYFSFGEGKIYNISGDSIGTYTAGISPEGLAVDYRDNTGIIDTQNDLLLSIYPNPANEYINISIKNNFDKGELSITDISGRDVEKYDYTNSSVNNVLRIHVSDLSRGIYFVKLKTSHKQVVKKFIKY